MPFLTALAGFLLVAAPPVDAVIVDARIWSPDRSGFVTFAAIDDGRFVHVGTPDPELIGDSTQVIDAQRRVDLPGLIESHVHMLGGGRGLSQLQLRTLDGKTWQTQEGITVGEALRCDTDRAAFGVLAENDIARVSAGYRADFVILEHSPFDRDVVWTAIRPWAVYVQDLVHAR